MAKQSFLHSIKQPLHKARRVLAKIWWEMHPGTTIIGVTGSYGKTSTTTAISAVLEEKFKILQTDLNLDTNYNLPITLLKLSDQEKLVLEMGVDKPGEMDYHLSLVKPSIGVVTGITPVHADPEHLGSLENIITEKGKLLASLPESGWAIVNYDDENAREMAKLTKAQVVFYGLDKEKCQVWADKIKVDFEGTSFALHYGTESIEVHIPLIGRHFVQNALAAAAVGITQDLNLGVIARGLGKLAPLEGRMSVEEGPLGAILLNDSRRANLASTLAGLETVADLAANRKVVVLGEMGEIGKDAEKAHRLVGKKVAQVRPDYLVAVGPMPKFIAEEAGKDMAKDRVFWVNNVAEAADVLKKILKEGDLFYLKGSLLRHMERILILLNEEDIECRLVVCHRYQLCPDCPALKDDSKSKLFS
ncbi:MAG: UDP-N-acetylmuramoyl-tripeptide--D-alanyl-D-alanine ligase [Patescibacteria group bacterium]|nr:UDP-N-acetylmuramoyl-tripeptide--D-alanyl-D-alanine ligase [Patescibacteria group bacterium]